MAACRRQPGAGLPYSAMVASRGARGAQTGPSLSRRRPDSPKRFSEMAFGKTAGRRWRRIRRVGPGGRGRQIEQKGTRTPRLRPPVVLGKGLPLPPSALREYMGFRGQKGTRRHHPRPPAAHWTHRGLRPQPKRACRTDPTGVVVLDVDPVLDGHPSTRSKTTTTSTTYSLARRRHRGSPLRTAITLDHSCFGSVF
jgi:hypothetical protein